MNEGADTADLGVLIGHLRRGIHEGRFVPGQRLIEADIVAETRASRARVREALRRLADEGLVQIDRNRGASVRRISRKEVLDTLEVLLPISILIADKAIDRVQDADARAGYERALADAQGFREGLPAYEQSRLFMDENARFWDSLAALTDNPILQDARIRLETTLFRLVLEGTRITSDKAQWIARHEEIIEAILAGDREAARRLVDESVRAVQDALMALPDGSFL